MPKTKNTELNELKLPSLPKMKIDGKDWEYRAFSPRVVKAAENLQALRDSTNLNSSETMDKMLNSIKEVLEAVFVKGDELFAIIDKRLGGDLVAWITFLAPMTQLISSYRNQELEADLERFKQQS